MSFHGQLADESAVDEGFYKPSINRLQSPARAGWGAGYVLKSVSLSEVFAPAYFLAGWRFQLDLALGVVEEDDWLMTRTVSDRSWCSMRPCAD